MAAAGQIQHPGVRAAYERDLKSRMRDYFWQLRQASRGKGKRQRRLQEAARNGTVSRVRRAGAGGAERRCTGQTARPGTGGAGGRHAGTAGSGRRNPCRGRLCRSPDVSLMRDAVLDFAHAGKPIDRGALSAHLAEAGNMRAASLLNEYPNTPPIAVDGPEAREWLIALEQYMVAGRSVEQDADAGMDDAGADATSSPSAWRRKHQLVAERRA